MSGMGDAVVTGITMEGKGGERLVIAAVEEEQNPGSYHYGIFMLDAVGNAEQVGGLLSREAYARLYAFLEPLAQQDDEYTDEEM